MLGHISMCGNVHNNRKKPPYIENFTYISAQDLVDQNLGNHIIYQVYMRKISYFIPL